jgi:hypothetical protein
MGVNTGTTAIYYNPSAPSWAERTFAIYLRQIQKIELANFLDTATLLERDPALITNAVVTRNIKSVTRRRYPGGPAISVPATTRSVVVGPSIKIGTWPGRPITLERPKAGGDFDPDDADVPMKVLQLTLEGSFPAFYQFVQTANTKAFNLRTNHGRAIFIES